jgi:hypothetical protein
MSQDPPRKRRLPVRWLALSEIVAVVAVVIAGLGYWDSHRERAQEARDKAEAAAEKRAEEHAATAKQSFILTGQPAGDRIRLSAVKPDQVIQTQTLVFPTPVRDDDVQTTGNPRIERGWFDAGLKTARRGGPDEGRLPVGIVTTYIEGGETRSDRSIYFIGYSLKDRMLRGHEVQLDGLSVARRGVSGDLQKAVDALWEGVNGAAGG